MHTLIILFSLCHQAIGEKKEEREAGTTMEVCAKQLEPLAAILEEKGKSNPSFTTVGTPMVVAVS
jgi:triosephosphate isomerase